MLAFSVPGPGLWYVGEHTCNPSLGCIIQGVQHYMRSLVSSYFLWVHFTNPSGHDSIMSHVIGHMDPCDVLVLQVR